MTDTTAIDVTHLAVRDQKPLKQEKSAPKKRGIKSKTERDQWFVNKLKKKINPN